MNYPTAKQRHHDLALKILVGRAIALKGKLPWSLEEDREMISQERMLWAALTPEEQAEEQAFLAALWGKRGQKRVVRVNPAWGAWAEGLGEVSIPDAAFGLQIDHFRPWSRGVELLVREHPEMSPVLHLLWGMGFQPASVRDGVVALPVPAHRGMQETERLVGVLARSFPSLRLVPGVDGDGTLAPGEVSVRCVYDAATGQAAILVSGLQHLVA